MKDVQQDLRFVRKDANPELTKQLHNLYEEFVAHDQIEEK